MTRASCRWVVSLSAVVLLSLLSLATASEKVHVGRATCGTTIPIDSQWMLDPIWSFSRSANVLSQLSILDGVPETAMQVGHTSISDAIADVVRSETGMSLGSVSIFELDPGRYPTDDCRFFWNPLLAAMDSAVSTAARLLVLDAHGSVQTCPSSAEVEVMVHPDESGSRMTLPVGIREGEVHSLSFATRNTRWPITFRVSANCTVTMLLLVNRHGSIEMWYVWIPATVFTAAVVLVVAFTMFVHDLPFGITALVLTLVFAGYLGSCVGLVLELLLWQSALGRMFPFPDAITLYCCLPILYLLLAAMLLARHRHRDILVHAMLRLAVYGLNCALCCGYWVAGYIIMGILTLLQFFLSNLLLSTMYAYFIVTLERAGLRADPLSDAAGLLWFAPLTPFAPCALMYYDLYVMDKNIIGSKRTVSMARESVSMYNALSSFPLLFLQNIWGIALLVAATAFHMPFVIPLSAAILLFGIQFVLSLEQCESIHRRWSRFGALRGEGASDYSSCCTRLCPMWPAIEHCVRNAHHLAVLEANAVERYFVGAPERSSRPPQQFSSEIPSSVRDVEMESKAAHFPLSVTVNNTRTIPDEAFWPSGCCTQHAV